MSPGCDIKISYLYNNIKNNKDDNSTFNFENDDKYFSLR